ncbi:MAG: hypothetical protein AAF843_05335 [Bacteroidota bacterium]
MKTFYAFTSACLMLLFMGCGDDDDKQTVSVAAQNLPLLSTDRNIGMIVGFNTDNPTNTRDSIADRWSEAVSAGMRVGRLQIDWPELEPTPGNYDKNELQDRLEVLQDDGLQIFLLISAYDSEGPVVPDDLSGKTFDDPELINRFNQLMDWVIPMLVAHDGYLISISNEADNSFGELENLSSELLVFLNQAKAHIHAIDARMAVTVTFAEGSLTANFPGTDALLEACDVGVFNFYGSASLEASPFYRALTAEEIRSDIQQMLDKVGDKNIVIQELGMHSGSDELVGSEEVQRAFFEVFFEEMEKEKRLKAAYVFQLVDWSPALSDIYTASFEGTEVPDGFVEAFIASLNTIGMIHFTDGRRKAVWDEFLFWVDRFSED